MTIPARSWYLIIASFVCLVFAGTGVFYLLNLKSPNALIPDSIEPTPENQIQEQEVYHLETTDSSLSAEANNYVCYDLCDYNFQCPDDLECLNVAGENRCVNPECSSINTCDCDLSQAATQGLEATISSLLSLESSSSAEADENSEIETTGDLENNYGIGGVDDDTDIEEDLLLETYNTEIEDASASPTPSATPKYNQNLPAAGTPALTLAIVMANSTLIGLGLLWKKHKFK